ncbi:MAG TPA: hypothetical protein VMR43_06595 [Variovorax sp.]|nr:hypothetical protein [Variovorax sp.]
MKHDHETFLVGQAARLDETASGTYSHLFALFSTVSGNHVAERRVDGFFDNGIKDLAAFLNLDQKRIPLLGEALSSRSESDA